jgi:archaellin
MDSDLTRSWYVDVYVEDDATNPVENANVTAYNSTGDVQFSVLSDASGNVRQTLTYYTYNTISNHTYYGNGDMTINVTKAGFDGNSTASLNLSGNIGVTATIYGTNPPSITLDSPTDDQYLDSDLYSNRSYRFRYMSVMGKLDWNMA